MSCGGNVPFVPRTFCPICVDLHRYHFGTSQMSLALTPTSSLAGTLRRHTDHQFPLCVFCLSVFFSRVLCLKFNFFYHASRDKWCGRHVNWRGPPCVSKSCAVRPVFARVAGELWAADPSKNQIGHEANAVLWHTLGYQQHPGPENQHSQHMLNQPTGSSPE